MDKWILLASICLRRALFAGSVKSNGVILNTVVRQMDTTTTLVATAFSIQNGLAFMMAPVTLVLLNIFSDRLVCVVGGILSGFAYVFCGLLLDSLWQLLFGFTVSGIGFGVASFSSFMVLQRHFEARKLAQAITVYLLFDYVGIALLPLAMQYFLSSYGLHNSLLLFGALVSNTILCGVASRPPAIIKPDMRKKESMTVKLHSLPEKGTASFLEMCINYFSSLFQHKHLEKLLVLEFFGYFIFVSWALFLVPLGESLGFSDEQAVLLSTAGGIGGLCGRMIGAFLFRINLGNPLTLALIPFLVTGLCFVVMVFIKYYYVIVILVFISGISQGLNSSLIAMTPTLVCTYHFPHAANIEYLADGIAMQFSGSISGIIKDVTGSVIHVYLFNAALSFVMVPVSLWWILGGEANLKCQ
ncbi:Monocarboxylate transporter 14 [Holothuria leucospilota]|uniref:Monocarboxylate transporter 14 n=1 Tax=Holothuria leucospilota TaxID=206669 RepID=A0A9Q1HJ37_HOLLE|nr:Monocarboxylate transporter 14 [Holothuria leucospilota]